MGSSSNQSANAKLHTNVPRHAVQCLNSTTATAAPARKPMQHMIADGLPHDGFRWAIADGFRRYSQPLPGLLHGRWQLPPQRLPVWPSLLPCCTASCWTSALRRGATAGGTRRSKVIEQALPPYLLHNVEGEWVYQRDIPSEVLHSRRASPYLRA